MTAPLIAIAVLLFVLGAIAFGVALVLWAAYQDMPRDRPDAPARERQ